MKKEKKDKHFIHKPTYPGGPAAFKEFIKKQLKYPQQALDNNVEGTVSVRLDIDHKGAVADVKVIAGPGYGCNEEAVRICKLLKFEVPKHRNVKVLFHKKLNIHFKLPKQKQVKISYQYKPVEGGEQRVVYSYNVNE